MKGSYSGRLLILWFCGICILNCRPAESTKDALQIAVAANLRFVIQDLVKDFKKQYNIPVKVVVGSSGKLYAQLRQGAPFHLFLSADMDYPQALYDEGMTIDTVQIYAIGSLSVLSKKKLAGSISDVLSHPEIRTIAIANPDIAPYGRASLEVLQHLKLIDLKSKLVYGESIAQTHQYIYTGAADIGISTLSYSNKNSEKLFSMPIPPTWHNPIRQGLVILSNSDRLDQAQDFAEYIMGDNAKKIMTVYGYLQK